MNSLFDPVSLAVTLAMLALFPLLVVTCTAFLKISCVLLMVRTSIGVQQVPANLVVYGIATVITLTIMSPVISSAAAQLRAGGQWPANSNQLIDRMPQAMEPLKAFMLGNLDPVHHDKMLQISQKFQTRYGGMPATERDLAVVMPAFVVSELSAAFRMGLTLFLPFVVIDLVVSCVLMALGMMMVSPQTITMPLKVILFVAVDGWSRLLEGLMLSYLPS